MIEDELRSLMTAHDEDAPSADGFTPVVRRDRRLPSVAAAVVVIALVVGGVMWLRSSSSTRPVADRHSQQPIFGGLTQRSPVRCPTIPRFGYQHAVPDTSNATNDALVPAESPKAAAVCAYPNGFDGRATGGRWLDRGLSALTAALRRLPRDKPPYPVGCPPAPSGTLENFLIRLMYADSVVWVSVPESICSPASNGRFLARKGLLLQVDLAQAYRYGVWDTDPSLQRLCRAAPDPLASAKLPRNPIGLTICTTDNGTKVYRYGRAALARPHLDFVSQYNQYLARGHVDSVCVTFDQAPQHIVAVLSYAYLRDVVLTGTQNCMQGPGDVAMQGKRGKRVFGMFTDPYELP